jgi:phage tail sheath gpL-like
MVSPSSISRVTGVEAIYRNFNQGNAAMLNQRLSLIGIGNDTAVYDTEKREFFSAALVAERYGWGSPLHLMAEQLLPSIGPSAGFPVTIIPLQKAAGATAATGSIGATGEAAANGSAVAYIGGIAAEFAITKGAAAAAVLNIIKNAINGVLSMPAIAGTVDTEDSTLPLTAKWSGDIGNYITIEIESSVPGITFNIAAFSGGSLDPDITPALEKIGNVWETFILNGFSYTNTSRLDKYQLFVKDRWGPLGKKPCMVAHGCTDDLETRTAITDLRKDDYANFLIVSTGSRELPFVVAAKGLISDIVTTANENPARNYKGRLTGLHTGADDKQENYSQLNASIMKGSSNNIKTGNVAELNDIVTFYHPVEEGKYPAKRYVVDLVKLQNIIYNVRLVMEQDSLKGAPLVSDNTVTANPAAVCPKVIKTYFYNLADSLAKAAIIQEPDFTKRNMFVKIDSENPKRVNVVFPVKLSGNVEVSSTDIYFGFYVGE